MNHSQEPKHQPRPLNQVEITAIPPLSPGEQSIIDFHSIINTLNVLRSELVIVGDLLAGNIDLLKRSLSACEAQLKTMGDRSAALRNASLVDDFEKLLIDEITLHHTGTRPDTVEFAESMANLQSVLEILKLRARELLARSATPDRWERMRIEDLSGSLRQFFVAVAKNSKGRFRVLENTALQTPQDYYIDLKFEAAGSAVSLPPVFVDVMRDLLANARKYTPPGGVISALLSQDDTGTHFVVRDSGCGIPPGEIQQVVHYGKRASNVASVRTLGGGFGLTKAFLVTKQFGGRFWIASELGQGTEIRTWLPPVRPGERENRPPAG